jgi:hypothetical protein
MHPLYSIRSRMMFENVLENFRNIRHIKDTRLDKGINQG